MRPHCGIKQTEEIVELDDRHNASLTVRLFIQTKQAVVLWVHGTSEKRYGMKLAVANLPVTGLMN